MAIDFKLAEYVYQLAELPQPPPIVLETREQQEFLVIQNSGWRGMSLWLRHLLLGEALAEEAFLTKILYCQPRAELMAAEFRLAIGVHSRSTHPVICNFESPAELWFYCQFQLAYALLTQKGLLEPAEIKGKRQRLNSTLRFINLLEDYKFIDWEEERKESQSIQLILTTEAQDIAKVDAHFDMSYYKPFLRQFKRSVNAEKNNKQLQDVYLLPNGELYRTRKNKKLPSVKRKEK